MTAQRKPQGSRHLSERYADQTHRPLHGLCIVVPVLLLAHVGLAATGSHRTVPGQLLLQRLLSCFGVTAHLLAPLAIVVVLVSQHVARRDPWRIRPKVVGAMLAEAVAWTLPLLALGLLRAQRAAAAAIGASGGPGFTKLCLDLGTGVYEEFLFRLVLISLALLVFVDVFGLKEAYVLLVAIPAGAVLFALLHPLPGPGFPWGRFLTLASQGVLWGTLFYFRGFGVCVASHVTWNLFVNIQSWIEG